MSRYDVDYWKRWQASVRAPPKSTHASECSQRIVKGLDQSFNKASQRPSGSNVTRLEDSHRSKNPRHYGSSRKQKLHSKSRKGNQFGKASRFQSNVASASAEAPNMTQTRKVLLKVPGGAIGQSTRHTVGKTALVDTPGPGEYRASTAENALREIRGGPFATAKRYPPVVIPNTLVGAYGSGQEDLITRRQGLTPFLRSNSARIFQDPATKDLADFPGPGAYTSNIERNSQAAIVGPPEYTSSKMKIEQELENSGRRFQLRVPLHSFGYGHACHEKEHVQFGQCKRGQCSDRAAWERLGPRFTPDADHLPVGQYTLLDLDGVKKSDSTLLDILCQLDLSERDHLGRTILQALAATEFEAAGLQLRKAKLLKIAADESYQSLDVNARDNEGNTALHLAIQTEQQELVEWLLRQGADPELENCNAQTPLHFACELQGHHRIYQLLQASISMLDMHAEIARIEQSQRKILPRRVK